MDGTGLRYNEGKTRYDLLPEHSLQKTADVFDFGSKKYGENNWEKGMKWTTVLSSLERHLHCIKRGEDYDPESGLLHIYHLTCNSLMLGEYYKIYPQGDNRKVNNFLNCRIGLDIDGVIANFFKSYKEYNNMNEDAMYWNFNWDITNDLNKYPKDFWMNIEPLLDPEKLLFEPACYITSRHCQEEWTLEWLKKNKFPAAPVYHLKPNESKLNSAKDAKLDMFIDDKYDTYKEFNDNGILCWLHNASHNEKYNVGFKRIYSVNEIIKK